MSAYPIATMPPPVVQKPVAPAPGSDFVIVPQTKIAFIGYMLLLAALVVMQIQTKNTSKMSLPMMFAYVVIAILGLYIINCTVLGKCNLYAWIAGYVILVMGIMAVLGLLMKM